MEHRRNYGTVEVLARFLRRRWRKPARALGLAAGALLLSAAVYLSPPAPRSAGAGNSPVPAEAGTVESLRRKGVGSPLEGQLKQVAVRAGDRVKKGQVLFQLDTTPHEAALKSAQAQAAAARQALQESYSARSRDLQAYEAEVAAARRELARALRPARPIAAADEWTLRGEGGQVRLVPLEAGYVETVDTSLEQARLQAAQAQLEERRRSWGPMLHQAGEAVAAADRDVKRLAALIGAGTRRSPMSGVVTGVYAEPGQWVSANVPLVRVDDPAGYRVVTQVDQETRKRLEPGLSLKLADGTRRGKVEKIQSGWDRQVFQYYVWIKPADTAGLQPGSQVTVKLPATEVASK